MVDYKLYTIVAISKSLGEGYYKETVMDPCSDPRYITCLDGFPCLGMWFLVVRRIFLTPWLLYLRRVGKAPDGRTGRYKEEWFSKG